MLLSGRGRRWLVSYQRPGATIDPCGFRALVCSAMRGCRVPMLPVDTVDFVGRLQEIGGGVYTDRIAALRAYASSTGPGFALPADDAGVLVDGHINIAPVDSNSLAFARTPEQVLSIVYAGGTTKGGFFPAGVNGEISTSG